MKYTDPYEAEQARVDAFRAWQRKQAEQAREDERLDQLWEEATLEGKEITVHQKLWWMLAEHRQEGRRLGGGADWQGGAGGALQPDGRGTALVGARRLNVRPAGARCCWLATA
jgi:Fe-S cluster assembly scaffold protein SufB